MNISEKRYPYPVLKPNGDDYEGSEFDVDIAVTASSEKVKVTFLPRLRDDGLRHLIGVEKVARIICHLECPKTVYRTFVELDLPVCEAASEQEAKLFEIPTAQLSGEVSVCPFIVATADIPAYTNPSFNPDYECEAFTIETGGVLAEGGQKRFMVETSREALAQSPSIFSVVPGDKNLKTLRLDYSGDKIRLSMPKWMYEKYGTLKDVPEDRETMWAMLFVPALVEILTMLGATCRFDAERLDDLKRYRWYAAIDRAVKKTLDGEGVDSDRFANLPSYLELASLVVKNSIAGAFVNMSRDWSERRD